MIYELGRMVLGSSDYMEISSQHFEEIERAKKCLIEALYIEEKFNLVVDNYLEFEIDLLEGAARNMVRFTPNYAEFQLDRSRINRRLINLLSTCKSYTDQSSFHLTNMFGKRSEVLNAFKQDLKTETGPGFRVMSEVRNFAQHRGYPIHSVYCSAKWTGMENTAKLPFSMVPLIDVRGIQEDTRLDKQVRKELKSKGENVDVRPLIRDYLAALGSIHERMRCRLKPHINEWEMIILGAIERFRAHCGQEKSVVGLAALAKNVDGKLCQEVPLFTKFIEYRKGLETQTLGLSTLARRYVTSEGNSDV